LLFRIPEALVNLSAVLPGHTLDRLQRKCNDLLQQVIAGKLTANAAAVKAGWRKRGLIPPAVVEERGQHRFLALLFDFHER